MKVNVYNKFVITPVKRKRSTAKSRKISNASSTTVKLSY